MILECVLIATRWQVRAMLEELCLGIHGLQQEVLQSYTISKYTLVMALEI